MATPKHSSRPPLMGAQLDLQVSYRLGTPLVYVKGDLDHQTAPQLRTVIEEECSLVPPAVLLELSEVPFVDSGGLSLMFDTVARLRGTGWLGLIGATSPVARLMEMTGLTERPECRVLPDLAAAAAALR
jgi:anti-anti-sigma factor